MQKYNKGAYLGQGTYGVVFAGKQKKGNVDVALKAMQCADHEEANNALSEVMTMCRLRHRSLVPCVDCFLHTENTKLHVYLVMPRYAGDLSDQCPPRPAPGRAPIPSAFVLKAMCQVADGLAYLHDQQLIHRDVKPQNILRRGGGDGAAEFALGDFGLAKVAGLHNTRAMGSSWYMAPEQHGKNYGSKADIWGLGVVGQLMISNERPAGDDEYKTFGPSWASGFDRAAPGGWARYVVGECLRHFPKMRPNAGLLRAWCAREEEDEESVAPGAKRSADESVEDLARFLSATHVGATGKRRKEAEAERKRQKAAHKKKIKDFEDQLERKRKLHSKFIHTAFREAHAAVEAEYFLYVPAGWVAQSY